MTSQKLSASDTKKIRDAFKALDPLYFNSAYFGPMPAQAAEAAQDVMTRQMKNPGAWPYADWSKTHQRVNEKTAQMFGFPAENISHQASVSDAISQIALGYRPKQKTMRVALLEGDYPSLVLPWLVAKKFRDIEITWLKLDDILAEENIAALLPSHLDLVCLSHVLFNTGQVTPIDSIGCSLKKTDALFIVDASQSLGSCVADPQVFEDCDMVTGVTYKWLLGPYGHAISMHSAKFFDAVERTTGNWIASPNSKDAGNLLRYTAECMPGGIGYSRGQTPNMLGLMPLLASLEFAQEIGVAAIARHNIDLKQKFTDGLRGHPGFTVNQDASAIAVVYPKEKTAEQLSDYLHSHKVFHSMREEGVRLAFHLFNTEQEVQKLLRLFEVFT